MPSKSEKTIQEMTQAGVHLGHRTSKLHPQMESFVVGIRNTVHVIDLEKTAIYLEKALSVIKELAKEKKNILFVGTKTPLKNLVKEIAEASNIPYVTERWLGGTFTNFKVVRQRAEYFNTLKSEQEQGQLDKYTKKERIKINKELGDLESKFGGIKDMANLPDAIFICDIIKDKLALKEATAAGIKTIAIVDTNANPALVDYPIPATDDAISAVRYILEQIKDVIVG